MAFSVFSKVKFLFINFESRLSQVFNSLKSNGTPPFALGYDVTSTGVARGAQTNENTPADGKSLIESIFGEGFLWAVPKSRVSREKGLKKKSGYDKIRKYATPKKNLIACLECGHWHEAHTICGNCYEKVREETEKMQEAMSVDDRLYNAPRSEVVYIYKDEQDKRRGLKDKHIVEMDKPRPGWWSKTLTKPTGVR